MVTIVTGKPALKYETVTRSLSTNWWNRPVANSVIVAVTNGWWAIKTEACHTLTAEPYTPTQELYRGKGTYTYISLSTWYQLVAEDHSVMWTWMIEKRNKWLLLVVDVRKKCAMKVFGNHDDPLINLQNVIMRCLFRIRASVVRSHLRSTGLLI